ncbi:hypothetical protein Hanom_Chr06g00569061 [Helianthus anomalus]
MSKMDPVPVPNRYRYRYRIYRTGYLFGTDSVPTFDIFGTGPVRYRYFARFYPQIPVPNRYRYRTGYIRYRYRYPLLRIFGTGSFGTGTGSVPNRTELIPKVHNM